MLDDGGLYGVTSVVGLSDDGRSFGIALRITGVCVCVARFTFFSTARMILGNLSNSVLQQIKKVATDMMIGQRMVKMLVCLSDKDRRISLSSSGR